MELERYSRQITLLLGFLLTAGALIGQQPSSTDGAPETAAPTNPNLLDHPIAPTATQSAAYREMDLLRRDGFSVAQAATVSLHVADKKGVVPHGLTDSAFKMTVNGTVRSVRVQAPGAAAPEVPLVLLVFPPNDPIVHGIGVREAKKYFGGLSDEVLPWKVGILDADGSLTPFTNGRSQLVANLDFVDHAIEPMQYTSAAPLPKRFRWEGTWLRKAEEAIALMQRFDGPKVILAMNPVGESIYGLNDQVLAHDGPEALTGMTMAIGGHIYVANVSGPDVIVPYGSASQDSAAQGRNLFRGPIGVAAQLSAAGAVAQYRTSVVMQTAKDTMGGFSNSFRDLAGYIHRDLDENYLLTFDMTAADRDKGTPAVEVELADHQERVTIVDIAAVGTIYDGDRKVLSKEVLARVKLEAKKPVPSPDFRITQHVDYFPIRGGLTPMLPMSALVEWIGKGPAPRELSVAESVEDVTLATSALDREVQAGWNGRFVTWERDGHLHPGHYVWRVAIHDDQGKVYSAVEQKVNIENPRGAAIMASSLIIGNSCWKSVSAAGGMRQRSEVSAKDEEQVHFAIDPMKAGDCRVRPVSPERLTSADLLRTFVRLYPAEKLRKKDAPESWAATFVLKSETGAVEARRETKFVADGGSGYLAFVEMPLGGDGVQAGPHTLEVEMRGPGIHGALKQSRQISIAPAAH